MRGKWLLKREIYNVNCYSRTACTTSQLISDRKGVSGGHRWVNRNLLGSCSYSSTAPLISNPTPDPPVTVGVKVVFTLAHLYKFEPSETTGIE